MEINALVDARNDATVWVSRLRDPDRDARAIAVDALVSLGARECAAEIAERTRDDDALVRAVAVRALWALGAEADALRPLVDDPDVEVRRVASLALELLA